MYLNKLNETLHIWLNGQDVDEWLFESFRDSNVKKLDTVEAYLLIDDTVEVLLNQGDESASIEVLETILCLAKTSCTTEPPRSVVSRKNELDRHFSILCDYAKNKLLELYRYYRI